MNISGAPTSVSAQSLQGQASLSAPAPHAPAPRATTKAGASVASPRVDAFEGVVESEADRNRRVVDSFYTAFEAKDGMAMAAAYAPNATFSDKVFSGLKGKEPGAMWRMLSENKDLKVRHEIVKVDGDTVTAKWIANYTFSVTGNDVENHVTATIKLKDGKIVSHTDDFDMSVWLRQAYGMAAKLPFAESILGGITRHVARGKLDEYIESHGI